MEKRTISKSGDAAQDYLRGFERGRSLGKQEGQRQAREETALRFYRYLGHHPHLIGRLLELEAEEVEKIIRPKPANGVNCIPQQC